MNTFIYAVCIFSVLFSQKTYTEADAIHYALQHNLSLKRATLKLDFLNKEIWQGYLTYLPTVTFNHSFVKFSDSNLELMKAQIDGFKFLLKNAEYKDPNFSATAEQIADAIPNTAFKTVNRTNLTAEWMLFQNGAALNWLTHKQTETKIEDEHLVELKKEVTLNVRNAFFDLVIAEKALKLHQKRLETTQERLEQVRRLFEKGLRSKSETLRWKLQVSQIEETLIDAKNQVALSQMNLNFVLGAPVLEDVSTSVPDVELGRFSNLTHDRIQSVNIEGVSLTKQAMLQYEQTETSKFLSYGKFLPSINARYVKQWQQHESMFETPDTWEASLNFSWNLFNGGKDIIEVQKSEITRYSSELQLEEVKRRTTLSLHQSFSALQKSRKQLETAEHSYQLARDTYESTKNRYDKGLTTNIEYLEAENALFEAEMNRILIYKSYLNAGFNLQHLIED